MFLSVAHWCLMLVSPMAENVPLTEVLSARLLHCKVTLLYFVINKYSEACKYLISHQKFDLLINLYYYGTALFCFVQCVIICYNHLFILMPTLSSSKPVVALLLAVQSFCHVPSALWACPCFLAQQDAPGSS